MISVTSLSSPKGARRVHVVFQEPKTPDAALHLTPFKVESRTSEPDGNPSSARIAERQNRAPSHRRSRRRIGTPLSPCHSSIGCLVASTPRVVRTVDLGLGELKGFEDADALVLVRRVGFGEHSVNE